MAIVINVNRNQSLFLIGLLKSMFFFVEKDLFFIMYYFEIKILFKTIHSILQQNQYWQDAIINWNAVGMGVYLEPHPRPPDKRTGQALSTSCRGVTIFASKNRLIFNIFCNSR